MTICAALKNDDWKIPMIKMSFYKKMVICRFVRFWKSTIEERECDFYFKIGQFTLFADFKIDHSSGENVLFMRKWLYDNLCGSEKSPLKNHHWNIPLIKMSFYVKMVICRLCHTLSRFVNLPFLWCKCLKIHRKNLSLYPTGFRG